MVKLEGRCVVYSRIEDAPFYTSIFEICGGISTILNSAIVYIRNLNDDPRFDNFYVVIVNIDTHLDQTADLDFILSLDPVLKIYDNKRIKEYEDELEELITLSQIETITPEINNTIIDYRNIIKNYNSSLEQDDTNFNLEDILDALRKFTKVIFEYNNNPYRILDYIDKKYYDGISNSVIDLIYDKFGMTLIEFVDFVKASNLTFDFIKKVILNYKIDGTVEIKKTILKNTVKRINDTNKRNIQI